MGGAPQSESNFVLALPTAFIIETGRHIYFSTGPGKAEVSRNKVELPRTLVETSLAWSHLGILKRISLRINPLRFLKLVTVEGEALTGPLIGVLEPSRHSSHVYTNERIPVTSYRVL